MANGERELLLAYYLRCLVLLLDFAKCKSKGKRHWFSGFRQHI